MGVIKRGVLGGFSGKVANVVGSSWKGIAVMKSLPLSVANPRTVGQVNQRTKFAAVVSVASQILTQLIKPNWDRFAQRESGYNAFVSSNITAFDDSGFLIGPNLKSSKGTLEPVVLTTCTINGVTKSLVGTFPDNTGTGNALATDTIQVVAINLATNESSAFNVTTTRADASFGTFNMPNANTGDQFYVYLSCRRADGSIVADSTFLAVTAI